MDRQTDKDGLVGRQTDRQTVDINKRVVYTESHALS
jgi:hypothetical protein